MTEDTECPECDNTDTEIVFTTESRDEIERVVVCKECSTEWSLIYSNPIVRDVHAFPE